MIQHAGLIHHGRDQAQLKHAVAQRMRKLQIDTPEAYASLLVQAGPTRELHRLVSLLVVQKTSFFRHRSQFDLFERRVLPGLPVCKDRKRIEIWSAGCSSGQEPYSIAMVLRRNLQTAQTARVLATDIESATIEKARSGQFLPSELKDLTVQERRWFQTHEGLAKVHPGVHSLVEFRVHNLLASGYPAPEQGMWDVIFCRNVLIYFSRDSVRDIVQRFREVLEPGGFLVVGISESLFQIDDRFELVSTDDAFVYRNSPSRVAQRLSPAPSLGVAKDVSPPAEPFTCMPVVALRPAGVQAEASNPLAKEMEQARGLLCQQRQAEAKQLLEVLCREHPAAHEPRLELARLAADDGDMEGARYWHEQALTANPLDVVSRFLLAVVLYRLGDDPRTITELKKLLFLDGSFYPGHYYLGLASERCGDLQAASRCFRNAIRGAESISVGQAGKFLDDLGITPASILVACRSRLEQLSHLTQGNGGLLP